ncbi:hypothetical protein Tco_1420375 [Tanacetum coccineum]
MAVSCDLQSNMVCFDDGVLVCEDIPNELEMGLLLMSWTNYAKLVPASFKDRPLFPRYLNMVIEIGARESLLGSYEELSDGGSPRVIVYGYDGLPMQPVPYVPEPEYPEYLVPPNAEAPLEDQPLPADASPTALSPGYVADFDPDEDPEEDPEEDHADYHADGGDGDDEPSDDDDDDDDTDDEDEEPFKDEDGDEEEEHLASANSSTIPIVDPVPSAGDTKAFETDEAAPTPVPSPRWHTARMSVRP